MNASQTKDHEKKKSESEPFIMTIGGSKASRKMTLRAEGDKEAKLEKMTPITVVFSPRSQPHRRLFFPCFQR